MDNFDVDQDNKEDMNNINENNKNNKTIINKKKTKNIKQINNNKNKAEFIEIKVIICEYISSKMFYKLLTLKLTPLFNNDYNSYFILFDGYYILHKNTVITLQDFEESKNPKEKLLAVSEPELEDNPELYSMQLQKYITYQNNRGFIVSKIFEFNLSNKYYRIYNVLQRNKEMMRKKLQRRAGVVKALNLDEDEEDFENHNSKKITKPEKDLKENSSINSHQAGSNCNNGISSLGSRNRKKDDSFEYSSLNKIKKIIYLSIPIILLVLIFEYIYLISSQNSIFNLNYSFLEYREFYKLYFQLFTSIVGIACIQTDSDCKSLVSVYVSTYNFNEIDGFFDFPLFIKVQSKVLAKGIMERRNNLVNIHKNIGNKKYNEIFRKNVEYFRLSQNFIKEDVIFNLTNVIIQFSDAILIICNSFQILTNETLNDPIFFLNKNIDPFSYLNNKKHDNIHLSNYQKEFYEMILNYKVYKEQFDNINKDLISILSSKSKTFKLNAFIYLNLDILLILIIASLLYVYIVYFEIILMKILNFINMTMNIKDENFSFSLTFSKKIENLETIIKIYKNDPVIAVQNLSNIYNDYQQYLAIKNKNNPNEINKKGYKKISNIENKKNEMDNIPKNQRIVTIKDIRNLGLTYYYLISFYIILFLFIGSYIYLTIFWVKYFSLSDNLYFLIYKNSALESSLYKAINIYDLMIVNNYTIDELSRIIFSSPQSKTNNKNSLIKSFYEDLQFAFNNQIEKDKIKKIYYNYNNESNFTCENLYEVNNDYLELIKSNSETQNLNDLKTKLIKVCEKSRLTESNDVVTVFERHFQYIKNGIISLDDFSEKGLIKQINTGFLGRISVFFNCIIIYVLDSYINQPHKIYIDNLLNLLKANIKITVILYIILDILLIFIVLFFYISNIKNYCNQFFLLKKIFKIFEIQE